MQEISGCVEQGDQQCSYDGLKTVMTGTRDRLLAGCAWYEAGGLVGCADWSYSLLCTLSLPCLTVSCAVSLCIVLSHCPTALSHCAVSLCCCSDLNIQRQNMSWTAPDGTLVDLGYMHKGFYEALQPFLHDLLSNATAYVQG